VEIESSSGFTVSASGLDPVWDTLSLTATVKLAVPAALGVPLITPPLDNVRPAGNDPNVIDQVYEPVPPLAANVSEYAALAAPAGRGEVVIIDGAGLIVSANGLDAVWEPVSLTSAVKLAVPAVVGVPLIAPPLDNVRPAGKPPNVIDHVWDPVPPAAANV